jgi:hypothetical protein
MAFAKGINCTDGYFSLILLIEKFRELNYKHAWTLQILRKSLVKLTKTYYLKTSK